MHSIIGLSPRTDISMGAHYFSIALHPQWHELVVISGLDEEKAGNAIESMGASWLAACGWKGFFDPDNCGFEADRNKPPGPNARPMDRPRESIRFQWGKWGLEHITVPGNACGLDIEERSIGAVLGGPVLQPHNIDYWSQKNLLLIVFTWFAESILLHARCAGVRFDLREMPKLVKGAT